MAKSIKQSIIKTCEPLLNEHGFYGTNLLYYRKTEEYLEIIEIYKDKYSPIYRVWASLVYLQKGPEENNIYYNTFQYIDNDLARITPWECKERYWLKGDRGNDFYFNDVYIAWGLGRVCAPLDGKKPFGFRIKKRTIQQGCERLLAELPNVFVWLEKKKQRPEGRRTHSF